MTEKAIDEILRARIFKILNPNPEYTDDQIKAAFFREYGNQYTEKEFWAAYDKIIDLLSWDSIFSDF